MARQGMDLNNLDKSNWQTYRFDQIAKNISERVDPNNTHLEVYVGLEHIDSDSIHIKRTGTPDDVNGQKLRCYPGDVIFGRRRAYQRKAAIATVDAFCSAHSLVLRANPDVIEPKLFPFFLHSDLFMHRAVDISVGSLSPTINWGTLKHQEFLLPPKHQQAEIAELLWAMDEVIEKELKLQLRLEQQLIVNGVKYFGDSTYAKKLSTLISKTLSGGTPDTNNLAFYQDGSVPWITTKILDSDSIAIGEKYITEAAVDNSAAKRLPAGNIVAGTRVGVGKFSINLIDISFSQDITGLVVDKEKIDAEFLVYQLNSTILQKKITPFVRGTTIKGITKNDLLGLSIFVPEMSEQIKIKKILKGLKNSIKNIKFKIEASKSLQKSLINQIF